MSRLESAMKAGYYPTPPNVVRAIAKHLKSPRDHFRILNPCAGEGEALRILRYRLMGTSYAIELDAERAEVAAKHVDRCITGDYAAARMPKKEPGISLLFLNPPYDHEEETGRLELKFLRDTQHWLMPGGVLVYLIPQYRISKHIATRLATHFKDVKVYRFPDPEFAAFRQVVIFAMKRDKPTQDDATTLSLLRAQKGTLDILPDYHDRYSHGDHYQIPARLDVPFYFTKAESDPEDVAREAHDKGAWNNSEWQDLMTIKNTQVIRPLMPLRRGHIAMVLAAGLMDNLEVEHDSNRYLVKGVLRKVKKDATSASDRHKNVHRTRESFEAQITILNLNTGELTTLKDQSSLRQWLTDWQAPLAQKIVYTFQPVHDMTYEGLPNFHDIIATHSRFRKLPGRRATGLFEAQKQVTAALLRRFMTGETFAFLQGKMGTGKTTIAVSLADVLKKYLSPDKPFPVIVTCPPHLTEKWPREISDIVPMARGIVVKRPSDLEKYVKEVERYGHNSLVIAIVPISLLKRGSGWAHSALKRTTEKHREQEQWNYQTHRYETKTWTEQVVTFRCPRCGQVIHQWDKGQRSYAITNDGYFNNKRICQEPVKKWIGHQDGVSGHWKTFPCGEPLYQEWRGSFPQKKRDGFGSLLPVPEKAYPIARYIEKNYPGFFELAIIDELHEAKAQSSDRGNAVGALVRASNRTLGMTGTMFGGFSTSLFHLLYRIDPRISKDFSWSDKMRWASLYGVLERVVKHRDGDDSYGVYSGLRRRRQYVKEQPGISPALVTRLLDSTAFLTLEDLDLKLPAYSEHPIILNMISGDGQGPDQAEIYNTLANDLLQAAKEDWSLMSEYLQTTLAWPNACWRDEETSLYTVPALDPDRLYPKEDWLRTRIWEEKRRRRKVLLFVRQTATRDIQPRLKRILEVGGLRVKILRSTIGTTRRERWINHHASNGLDVLICNPRLVQTGLDLCQFPTIVVYEPEYSIYLMMQATARSWRPGQTRDVEVYFPVYSGTMEHRAVAHVGKKIAAAQLLYGDDIAGALVEQAGIGGNFLADLANEVIANTEIPDLNTIFVQKSREARSGWLTGRKVDLSDSDRSESDIVPEPRWEIVPSAATQISMF